MRQLHGHIATESFRQDKSGSLRDLCDLLFKMNSKASFGTEGRKDREVHFRRSWLIPSILVLMFSVALRTEAIAGPRVDIVIGEKAPALERLAADELSGQLKRVYEADVKIGSTAPADAPHVIFVGSPDTNASMKPFADSWPSGDKKLTDQGHLLRSVTHNNRPALLIGGGSPVATYWGVAEHGHRLGIRSMLYGDLDPISPPPFKIDSFDVVMEPVLRSRGWYFRNEHPLDSGAWGWEEYRRVLKQLAKLRFNRVTIYAGREEPFVHFEYGGVKRSTATFVGRYPIFVSGDTAGRKAFGGAKVFEHPDFVGTKTYEEHLLAGQKQLRGVLKAAQELGMTVILEIPLGQFPKEFKVLWPEDVANEMIHGLNFFEIPNEPQLAGLLKAQLRAFLDSYPTVDGLQFWEDLKAEDADALRTFLSQPNLLRRADGHDVVVTSTKELGEPSLRVVAPFSRQALRSQPKPQVVVELTKPWRSILPHMRPKHWARRLSELEKLGGDGFVVFPWGTGEQDLPANWLSRASFDVRVTPEQVSRDILTSVCGEEVHERVWKAFELIEQAAELNEKDFGVGRVASTFLDLTDAFDDMIPVRQPPPDWWGQIRSDYLDAMNEMYRANTRAREGGRSFTLYFARRFEFAFEYMNCIEAVRKAGIAERKKDSAVQIAELEKAIESLNNGLNAMAAVARSNGDRALIAWFNEYDYRPLKKKLTEAEEAAK